MLEPGLEKSTKLKVRSAFLASREGWSSDFVVVDPRLNAKFIDACRAADLDHSIAQLNLALLNVRKTGLLRGLRAQRAPKFDDRDYRHAAEMAARHLEHRDTVSLDTILATPTLREEFDGIVQELAPGFDVVRYRWCAFKLRKTRRLRPELVARVVKARVEFLGALDELDLDEVPESPGVYIFYSSLDQGVSLYVGESDNLARRIRNHKRHSHNPGLCFWFRDHGHAHAYLEIHLLDAPAFGLRERRALEAELIQSRRPLCNLK